MNQYIKDLKVLELSSVLAGPLCGTFFAELGANVIKIENKKTNGDVTRSWKTSTEDPNTPFSAYYFSANYGKKSILADLSDVDTLQMVYDSIKHSDIVIVNFKAGDDKKLKLDYTTLKKINPAIIYASISGFGEDDERVAFDAILQAETGFMSMNGHPGSTSIKMPVALIDVLAAHQLKEGILLALINKILYGIGSKVHVSLYDSAIASLVNQACNWLMNHTIPQKLGSAHPNIAPYGDIFISADNKELLFAIGTQNQFIAFCDVLSAPEIAADDRFRTNANRVNNRNALVNAIQNKVKHWNSSELYFEMIHKKIPVGLVKNLKDVFDDEKAQHLILKEEHDGLVSYRPKTTVFTIQQNL